MALHIGQLNDLSAKWTPSEINVEDTVVDTTPAKRHCNHLIRKKKEFYHSDK